MCGIAGIIARRDKVEMSPRLDSMIAALVHRGPDGRGSTVMPCGDWVVGIGHTRLAILDLSCRGAQPMADQDSARLIAYNGEIYNFPELREELCTAGAHFSTRTDTEVVLKGYTHWGRDVLKRLRGMFAFAIWNGTTQHLVLARDSLGIKPLYFYATEDLFLFASEVRALLASGLVPRKLDVQGLASYLQFGSVGSPRTLIRGIESIEPGECLQIRVGGQLELSRSTFEPEPVAPLPESTRRKAAQQLADVLAESVRRHLISDVPVGLFLSGGIDSTAIAGLMGCGMNRKPQTFNIAFTDREYSESTHASLVSAKCGTDHREIVVTEDGMLKTVPDAIRSMDQPTMDGINTWAVSKAVRDAGIKVALSGLGGDELFAGYASFRRALMLNRMRVIPRALRAITASTGRAAFDSGVVSGKFWDLLDSDTRPASAYLISRRLFAPREIERLTGVTPPPPRIPACDGDVINSVSRLETRGYMTNTLLRDTDFMSMAHGIEVRVPFVDTKVIDFVMQLPGAWKIDGARQKPLLLDALGDLVPEEIWHRPKMGFTFPFRKWMLSSLRPEIDAVLGPSGRMCLAGVRCRAASAVWERFRNRPNRERWSRPWSLYVLQKWCESNEVEL
jgi:asparagine synthase (glutamine-hydrolysing)